jgi:hypothetical protein
MGFHGVRVRRSPIPESEQWDARGAADSACFEWNDHCGGPVIRGVLLPDTLPKMAIRVERRGNDK